MQLSTVAAGLEVAQVRLNPTQYDLQCFSKYRYSNHLLNSAEEVATVEFNALPVNSQCLNLMQETQEKFYSKRMAVADDCSYWNGMEFMNLHRKERQTMDAKSQLEKARYNGPTCKQNVTEECKTSFHDFLTTISNIAEDEELKKCVNTSMILKGAELNRNNDFLFAMIPELRDHIKFMYDIAKKSCKFV